MDQWRSQRLTWPTTWAQVCWWLRPEPSPAQPLPTPGLWERKFLRPQDGAGAEPLIPSGGGLDSTMEPVETWSPGKVAAWLRGGWGRGRVGLEGHWDRER